MGIFMVKQRLRGLDPQQVPKFSLEGNPRWARVCKIYDGDTVTILTFVRGKAYKFQLRMSGYDCPEMKPRLDNADRQQEIEASRAAKGTLESLIGNGIVRMDFQGWDMYGRALAVLFNERGQNINDLMISHGWGLPYQGGKKTPFNAANWSPRVIVTSP